MNQDDRQNGEENKSYEDMVEMNVLNQNEILKNIRIRYSQDKIFTLIGPTLIVMNPYKHIQNVFDEHVMQMIADRMKDKQERLDNLQNFKEYPHIYSISASAYENLFKNNVNQSIVISGESGAGKTENAKYAMSYLTQLSAQKHNQEEKQRVQSRKSSINRSRESSVASKTIEQQILFCNPIMEAFGNAKTVRNNNSSRFGKYVSILVECNTQTILGAQIQKYLLEKSRVTHIANNERNYHIFYHLLSNKSITEQLNISNNPADYYYLNQSGVYQADSIDDNQLFQEVQSSFQSMGFYSEKILTIWQILASILLIGNIQFESIDEENTIVKNQNILSQIGKLLQCEEELIEKALTHKILETGKSSIQVPLKQNECISVRNSLSKVLYDRLFTWLVQQLNSAINPPALKSMKSLSIGLLDIFGFENFQINSFEQMCINYTNERLQKLYISYVFINEEKILREDGLAEYLNNLSYSDNQPVVDLIDSNQGVLQLLNDQCKNKGGNDKKFLESLKGLANKFDKIQFPKIQKDTFIIKHTASDVEYSSEDFCDKNKDEVSKQIENCIRLSRNQVVVSIFSIEGSNVNENNVIVQKDKFLGEKFRNQMNDLMSVLNSCQVHFVRCIKPNETKQQDNFVEQYVSQQIQYLGVLESIEVRKQMYPYRKTYQQFYDLFYIVDEQFRKQGDSNKLKQNINYRPLVEQLIKRNFSHFNQNVCLYGTTKIYLKSESERELDVKKIQIIQKLQEEAMKMMKILSDKIFRENKQKFIRDINQASKQFRLSYLLRNILIFQSLKISNAKKRILVTWKYNANKLKEQDMERKRIEQEEQKLKKIQLEKERQRQKEEEEERKKNQQEEEDQDDYYDEYEKKMAHYIASDTKSNMHLINQTDAEEDINATTQVYSDTKRNLISQLNENSYNQTNNQSSNYNSILDYSSNYQSVIDQSYASITGIKLQEMEDQRKIDEIINKENDIHKQPDHLFSQYVSIGKYYASRKDLVVSPPTDEEKEFPPLILSILDTKYSFEEGEAKFLYDVLNIEFKEAEISKQILSDFRTFALDDFLKEKLKKRTKNLFQTKTIKEIMTVSHKELSSGLTKLTKEEDKKAVEIFKDILQLMDKKDEAGNMLVDIIIQSLMLRCRNSTLLLKDEVYLQMLKQINNNKNKIEITRVLQLMVAFSYTYKPSLDVIFSTLQFLDTIYREFKKNKIDEFQAKLFQYLLNKLIRDRIRKQNEKEYPLAAYQVRYLINLKQINFPLILPNGSQYCISVDPTFTINDLKIKALELMHIPARIPSDMFAIYEIQNIVDEYDEKILQETDFAWDLISEFEYKKNQCYNEGKQLNSFFLLKIKYGYKFNPNDVVSVSYFYTQTQLDVISRKILLKKEDNLKIACLNIYLKQQNSGSYNLEDIYQITDDLPNEQQLQISEEIQQTYLQIAGCLKNKLLAKLEYISILSKYDEYMGWILRNVKVNINSITSNVFLNINPYLIIFNYEDKNQPNKQLRVPVECISNQYIENENHLILQIKANQENKLPHMIVIQTVYATRISQYFSKYIELLREQTNSRSLSLGENEIEQEIPIPLD